MPKRALLPLKSAIRGLPRMLCPVLSLWLSLRLFLPQQAPWLYKCLRLSSVPLFICYSQEPLRPVQRWSQLAQCIYFWPGFSVFLGKMKRKTAFKQWLSLLADWGLTLYRPHVWAHGLCNPWFPGCTCLQIVSTVTEAILPTWNISFTVPALWAMVSCPPNLTAPGTIHFCLPILSYAA